MLKDCLLYFSLIVMVSSFTFSYSFQTDMYICMVKMESSVLCFLHVSPIFPVFIEDTILFSLYSFVPLLKLYMQLYEYICIYEFNSGVS